jgi:Uma2 family endonuclease
MSTGTRARRQAKELPVVAIDLPVMYEDDGQEEMGEIETHTDSTVILHYGLRWHWGRESPIQVFKNLNLLYHPTDQRAYVSPDVMAIRPQKLRKKLRSYRVGTTGPAPFLAAEVLSKRSFQQQDLTSKPEIYADMKVAEHILADVTGEFLSEKLLIKKLQSNGSWRDLQDADGGITSQFGFRVVIEPDDRLRVVNAQTGQPYARPDEAEERREQLTVTLRLLLEIKTRLIGLPELADLVKKIADHEAEIADIDTLLAETKIA